MQTNLYVGLSGQMAIEKRLQPVANNIANMNTAGYRADGVTFQSVLSTTGAEPVAFSTEGETYISRRAGEMTKTDNPLDVAVQGDAWLGIRTAHGVAYTHDGRMKITTGGEVRTLNDDAVLDAGGAALQLDPNAGPPTISGDGMMTQAGRQVGAEGLISIDADAKLTRTGTSAVIPSKAATPVLDFTNNGIVQGFVEGSNINPVLEISRLIDIQHSLESVTHMNEAADTTLQDAVRTLGATS